VLGILPVAQRALENTDLDRKLRMIGGSVECHQRKALEVVLEIID
jgi:hypothetical protein